MTARLLLAPHNDDEALFASHLVYAHGPFVVVCLYESDLRWQETVLGLHALGLPAYHAIQWPEVSSQPDFAATEARLRELEPSYDVVYAPAVEEPGPYDHAVGRHHHYAIGQIARDVFGPDRVQHYLTYTAEGRSTNGVRFEPEAGWVTRKHSALACYRSQIMRADTRAWFTGPLDEYMEEAT